jgi:hypothetical protein
VLLGHAHGLPVLATTAGTFAGRRHDGVDGLLVPPDDAAASPRALRGCARRARWSGCGAASRTSTSATLAAYVAALTARGRTPRRDPEPAA